MKTLIVNFPAITAEQIYKKSKNKVGKDKLLWDIDWYRNEDFFTKEKTRKGKREVDFELKHLGKSWNECNELKRTDDFLNFVEVLYLTWKYPEFRKMLEDRYTWTSSRASDGRLVNFGNADAAGACVRGWAPDTADGGLGVAFARSLENLKSESCKFVPKLDIEITEIKVNGKVYKLQ